MRHFFGSFARGFVDRRQAGAALGNALAPLVADVPRERLTVLGLARGGVVVANEVATILEASLDACVVRKIGSPYQPELAIGAVGPENVRVLNHSLIRRLGIADDALENLIANAFARRDELDQELRGNRELPRLDGAAVVLVDDGLATGASMRAATGYAQPRADAVIVAVPTAAPDVVQLFESLGFQTISLITSGRFGSVGQWYERFDEVTSADTRAILDAAWQRFP